MLGFHLKLGGGNFLSHFLNSSSNNWAIWDLSPELLTASSQKIDFLVFPISVEGHLTVIAGVYITAILTNSKLHGGNYSLSK
jgi:hypothetical protein